MDDMNLGDLRSIRNALGRVPSGAEAIDLAERLGLWSSSGHQANIERKAFRKDLSKLGATEISDEMGYWTSEMGRISEIMGAITGQRELIKLRLKATRAAARGRVRRDQDHPNKDGTPKPKMTASQVNDSAEEDPAVVDLDEQAGLIELLAAHTKAAQEATAQYIATLSREISWRTAQQNPGRGF